MRRKQVRAERSAASAALAASAATCLLRAAPTEANAAAAAAAALRLDEINFIPSDAGRQTCARRSTREALSPAAGRLARRLNARARAQRRRRVILWPSRRPSGTFVRRSLLSDDASAAAAANALAACALVAISAPRRAHRLAFAAAPLRAHCAGQEHGKLRVFGNARTARKSRRSSTQNRAHSHFRSAGSSTCAAAVVAVAAVAAVAAFTAAAAAATVAGRLASAPRLTALFGTWRRQIT